MKLSSNFELRKRFLSPSRIVTFLQPFPNRSSICVSALKECGHDLSPFGEEMERPRVRGINFLIVSQRCNLHALCALPISHTISPSIYASVLAPNEPSLLIHHASTLLVWRALLSPSEWRREKMSDCSHYDAEKVS